MSEESEAPKEMAERGWIAEPAGARFPAERHPPSEGVDLAGPDRFTGHGAVDLA